VWQSVLLPPSSPKAAGAGAGAAAAAAAAAAVAEVEEALLMAVPQVLAVAADSLPHAAAAAVLAQGRLLPGNLPGLLLEVC
jgi:hypothetical protein